jgi:hypothetical protein
VGHAARAAGRVGAVAFSLPPHWVASSGSSTAMMMSATVTLSARRASCSRRPGRGSIRRSRGGAACRTAAPGRTGNRLALADAGQA